MGKAGPGMASREADRVPSVPVPVPGMAGKSFDATAASSPEIGAI